MAPGDPGLRPGESRTAQVAVIGAGPAGLAAANQAADAGAEVVLIDAAPRSGGQFWRHADPKVDANPGRWHHGWKTYQKLSAAVEAQIQAGRISYLSGHQVITLTPGGDNAAQAVRAAGTPGVPEEAQTAAAPEVPGAPRRQGAPAGAPFTLVLQPVPELAGGGHGLSQVVAPAVVLCPGTYDRQLPVPGWTLPGVMAAGGIQAFIKTHGVVPGSRVVLGGTGPFLLSAAASIIKAGGEVAALCEAAPLTGWLPGARLRPGAAAGALVPSKAVEGAEYIALLAKHRVPYLRRTVITGIHGDTQATAVTLSQVDGQGTPVDGTQRDLHDVDLVGLGWGFAPQSELLVQSGAQTRVDIDTSLVGVVDAQQRSTVPGLYLAGEITGVAGATAAVVEGRIAGRAVAAQVTGASLARAASLADRVQRRNHHRFAASMHTAHPVPAGWESWMEDDTVVCRCEEVPYSKVREATETLGAQEPRGLKGVTRTGMGWCQGRMCGAAALCLARNHESAATAGADVSSARTGTVGARESAGADSAGPGSATTALRAGTRSALGDAATAPEGTGSVRSGAGTAGDPLHSAALSIAKRPLSNPVRLGDLAASAPEPWSDAQPDASAESPTETPDREHPRPAGL